MIKEIHDRDLFNKIYASYALKDKIPSSALPRKQLLLKAVQPLLTKKRNLGTIVDIGCGIGASAMYLSGFYAKYIGIDQSFRMIDRAKHLHRENKKVTFLSENIKSRQKLPHHVADLILSVGALHHMSELDQVMNSLRSIAKNHCHFVAIEPQNGNPLIQVFRYIRGIIDKNYSREQIFFSERQLLQLFRSHRLADITTAYFGFFSTPFAELIMHPQVISFPLSRAALRMDNWLDTHLAAALKRICFKIIVRGQFQNEKFNN